MKYLRNWLEILTGVCLFVVVIVTFLQVLLRFVLKIPAPWTEEITRLAFAYMVFLGSALGVKYHNHLDVDMLYMFPKKIRPALIIFGYLISIAFVGIFTWYGWIHTMNSKLQTTPTLEFSLMYMYIIMPISGLLMEYYLIKEFVKELRGKQEGVSNI